MDPNKLLARAVDLIPSGSLHGPTGSPLTIPPSNVTELGTKLTRAISVIIGFLTIIAGIWFLIQTILAGYAYMSAGGDKEKVHQSQKRLTQSTMGLIIVILALFFTSLLGYILKIDFLDIRGAISKLTF